MARKLDLSGLSDLEAAHVLQVVQRDMRLRKKEDERLSELKQELSEEGSRSRLLSRQSCFNQRCCIRCCAPFTFLLNSKRRCGECGYNVCRSCRLYCNKSKGWLCSSCQKHRLLKTQSLEWFYSNVKSRFKRFGSAKVLKTLYKKHLTEHNILSELTDGSGYEESVCNDGSICGSDSAFYKQTEEHSMSETLTVARRVAEETIDEAISKAEVHTYSQEKKNEAHYLRQHRAELIEELATTIVEKIISRRNTLAQIKSEYDQDLTHTYYDHFVPPHQQQPPLWRSHSLSLLDTDSPGVKIPLQSLKKDRPGPSLSAWKSVDRLDNSVLKSPDGNWLVLQSGQLSRPSLLTKRKSQVYSALEQESGAVSAYEALDSDCEPDSSWGAVLKEIHKKMNHSDLLEDLDLDYVGERRGSGDYVGERRGSRDYVGERRGSRDSEGNCWKSTKALMNKKVPVEIRKPSSSRRTSIIDMNFNEEREGEREDQCSVELEERRVRRSRRKRRSRREAALYLQDHRNTDTLPTSSSSSDAATPETLTSGASTPDFNNDLTAPGANQTNQELTERLQQLAAQATVSDDSLTNAQNTGDYMDLDEGHAEDTELDNDAKDRLFRLVAQSRLVYLSSTDDDLDKAGVGEEEPSEDLKFKLCRLEQEVKSTQFSSTEDELDRKGLDEDSGRYGDDGETPVEVSKLFGQVDATQLSSTEDELDGVGTTEEAPDDADLWKLQAERTEKVRSLAGLVSLCEFSSSEDELERVGEGKIAQNDMRCLDFERRESIGDLDVNMFELGEDHKTINYLEMSKAGDVEACNARDLDRRESIDLDESMFEFTNVKTHEEASNGARIACYKAATSIGGSNGNEASLQGSKSLNEMDERQEESDSEADEAEFNRIINGMLMMTLEDMQVGGQRLETSNEQAEDEHARKEPGESYEKMESRDDSNGNGLKGQQGQTEPDSEEKTHLVNKVSEDVIETKMTSSNTDVGLESDEEQSETFTSPGSLLSPEEILKRRSAKSLSSITTEVLKVLNATERLLQETHREAAAPAPPSPPAPVSQHHRELDQQLCRLEEHVYLAAGSVYSLETELGEMEECARAVSSSTSVSELSFLEEQVATAAAKVQQTDTQISDISARIAALRSAGLNVSPQPSFSKFRTPSAKSAALDLSRQQRRLLPAPPTKES